MAERIHIPVPCSEDWNKMSKNTDGRMCDACQTTVVDFSNRSLEEIKTYFEVNAGKNVCGQYRERHVTDTKWYNFLNSFEILFSKARLGSFAVGCITFLLLITGCYHRKHHPIGRLKVSRDNTNKDPNTIERVDDVK
jgi:hypothetical protein